MKRFAKQFRRAAVQLPEIPHPAHIARREAGHIRVLPYAAALLVILTVMFLTYKVAYHKEYLTSGQEEYKLRMELADKLRRLPLSFFGLRDLSDVTGIIMDDVQTMSHVLSQSAAELIGGILTGIVALVVLFIYDWRLALYLAVCMPVVLLVMALSRKISEGTNKKNRRKKLDVSAGLQEYLENIKLLRTTEAMGDYQQGLCKKVKHIIPGLVLYELLAGLSISISYNVMRVGLGLVILFGSGMLAAREITLFKFLIFLYAAVRIYEPLTSACEHLGDFIASLVGAGRVSALLAKPEQGGSEDITVDRFDIRFDHVRFAYNHEEVLHDVSFTAKQGEITALVGPSGSGKSTLARLAARFWDVQSGSVSLGGVDLRQIAPEELLKNYSLCFRMWCCLTTPFTTTSKSDGRTPQRKRSTPPPSWQPVTNLFTVSRTNTKPLSAKMVRPSPAANGSGFLSPGRF